MSITFCTSEEEAGLKTCPQSIGVMPVYHPTDGQGISDGGPWGCVGGKCMAWRWVETNISDGKGGLMPSTNTHGYCGLAGMPAAVAAKCK